MTRKRWNKLMETGHGLTRQEFDAGWHYCFSEWDGLLIGPGMGEFQNCNCDPTTFEEAVKHANEQMES